MKDEWDMGEMTAVVEHALETSRGTATVVRVRRRQEGATRFSGSEITQNVATSDATVDVEVAFDASVGAGSANQLDAQSVVACVRRAEAIARVAPPDPEYMPPVEPAPIPEVETWHDATAAFSPIQRAEAIRRAIAIAQAEGMAGAGILATRAEAMVVGNSAGHLAENQSTQATVTFSATSPDSVGWAQGRTHDVTALDVEAVARRAVDKARAGHSPRDVEAGRYEVILEPAATAELLAFFFWYQMDAKAADEGRTFLAGKKGSSIAAPKVTLFSDPTFAHAPTCPFTDEGLPMRRVDWIRRGVLENLSYSRYWAARQGVAPTGRPRNMILEGGPTSVEAMVRATKKGLLVTRFWYVRVVEPMRDLFTGMTRDGTFLIRDGEIVGPVRNLRFNESAVRLLRHVELLGEQELVGEWDAAYIPYLKARDFSFTSTTRF